MEMFVIALNKHPLLFPDNWVKQISGILSLSDPSQSVLESAQCRKTESDTCGGGGG